jgi:hypothetical protein
MDGPAFSARRVELNRHNGFDVIGMTNLPEAKLARKRSRAREYGDDLGYDCWKIERTSFGAGRV